MTSKASPFKGAGNGWESIGPLKYNPDHMADWNYFNSDGFGLLEYLEWAEDMKTERVLAICSNFSLDVWEVKLAPPSLKPA
ncbi:glycoside hydrolase family 51 protein [Lepidopterella palustris CBS 459.81]|uniref:Glycoside hydrolase family 51 protein n=1 Tax=Lepidopterella palustris CBS 459.81 TaxID=1314670 RepID=A0A8E2EA30_9PEZI|nr:glycoside hydrolase family 51 protein [Lepidopterella palustris CBS 459.81]